MTSDNDFEPWLCWDTKRYINDPSVEQYEFINNPNGRVYYTSDYNQLWLCSDCDAYHHEIIDEPYEYINNRGYREYTCKEHYIITCDNCNDPFHQDLTSLITLAGSDNICGSCYESGNYFTCEACEEVFHSDDYGSDNMCSDCVCNQGDLSDVSCWNVFVKSYGTDALRFLDYGDKSGFGWIGIEYETLVRGDDRRDIEQTTKRLLDVDKHHWIATADSSLEDLDDACAGIEFITRPASYAQHVNHFEKVFSAYGQLLKNTRGCGMHVHMSNEGFVDDDHMGRVVSLIESFTDSQLKTLGGRTPTSYCARVNYSHKTGLKYKELQKERYALVNSTDKTVEFRFLRTTKTLDVFKSRLQLIVAIRNYCKDAIDVSISGFFTYIYDCQLFLPELYKTIQSLVDIDDSVTDYWGMKQTLCTPRQLTLF